MFIAGFRLLGQGFGVFNSCRICVEDAVQGRDELSVERHNVIAFAVDAITQYACLDFAFRRFRGLCHLELSGGWEGGEPEPAAAWLRSPS